MENIKRRNNENKEISTRHKPFVIAKGKTSGITLIALVVTIVILLILGITIGTLTGENGLIKQAQDAKTQTEIAEEKEVLDTATVKAMAKDRYGNLQKENLDSELNKSVGENKYTSEEIEEGIAVTFTNSNRSYLVDIDGNITEYEIRYPVEIPETGGTVFSRANGIIDIKFLVGTGYSVGEANVPKIDSDNMIPVNWDGTNWVVTNEEEWEYSYDETNKQWANVMLRDTLILENMTNEQVQNARLSEMKGQKVTQEGSMLVWIPRYCYKITYYASSDTTETGTIVGYSDSRGLVDAEGKTPEGFPEPATGIAVEDNYRPHPAFETDLEQGGWSSRISGIWIGKFETTQKVNGKVTIRPGVRPYASQTIGTFYADAQDLEIANSHMLKNSEWGAMTYLTQSKYGTYPEKNGILPEFMVQGDKYYIENVNLSTTGNIYGIYDTFGLSKEAVAGYIADNSNSYGNIFASIDDTTNNKETSTKFATVYLMSEGNGYGSNYKPNINRKFGDALIETSTGGIQWKAWLGKATEFVGMDYYGTYSRSYFARGENYTTGGGGPLSFGCSDGNSNASMSFRMCLITK